MAGRTSGRTSIFSFEIPHRERSVGQRGQCKSKGGPDSSATYSRSVVSPASAQSSSTTTSQSTVVSPSNGVPVSTNATFRSNQGICETIGLKRGRLWKKLKVDYQYVAAVRIRGRLQTDFAMLNVIMTLSSDPPPSLTSR